MIEYNYKRFKIHYDITADKTKKDLYAADGYVSDPYGRNKALTEKRFHTEYVTKAGVKDEIKKLIENYIDFEWQEFYEIHGKDTRVRH
jgi:hypothetical protein